MSDPQSPMTSDQLTRLKLAQQRLDQIEEHYRADRSAARAELSAAARALSKIETGSERLAAVAWANDNTAALKADLAWAIFKRERHEYHLRKLLAGPYRECDECGNRALAGHQFETSDFFCPTCAPAINAARQRQWKEARRRSELERVRREDRISELKARAGLPETEANELAALIISQVDGPSSQLSDFLVRSLRDS